MKYKEIEYKYEVPFTKRVPKELLKGLEHSQVVSGFDYYYTDWQDKTIRFRDGLSDKELTTKQINFSTAPLRTVIRDEVNLKLGVDTTLEDIRSFCKLLGYALDLQIYKAARIFYYKDYVLTQYRVTAFKENAISGKGDYFEIELKEGTFDTEKESIKRLKEIEKQYRVLGLNSKTRINRSLYEIYS